MDNEEFCKFVDENFDSVIDLMIDDYTSLHDALSKSENSHIVYAWAQKHKTNIVSEIGGN
ncbi:hypothetical protein N6G95_09625 [Pediococcus inopinatus]|uniref:hypothetical protein n=1 Tax=Pediococcus inopinatus TaxID=114090 RepID=UPI002B2570AA|nr:hypothetical protein [Pediococcus inopinatus]WPC19462.1 hypothetical protein N6G95_09625 [Pediococcus inopinatus]